MWTITKYRLYDDKDKKQQRIAIESRGKWADKATALKAAGKLNAAETRLDVEYWIEEIK